MATSSPHPTVMAQTAIQPNSQGSHTITIAALDSDREPANSSDAISPRLILRARPLNDTQHRQQRVQWGENVVDNEGLGRKKSKVCCIYNKPKAFDESSDESDHSHSDSDCCPQRPSTSGPCPSTAPHTERAASASTPISSQYTLPTPPRSPNAYEAEPSKAKGKGKAG